MRETQITKSFKFAHEEFFIGEHGDGRGTVFSVDIRHLEEVEVRGENPFGGRGTLEFSDQARVSPEAAALDGGKKISGRRRRVCGAA